MFTIGRQPINVQAQAFYNAEKPSLGADWQLQLLFPKQSSALPPSIS